MLYLVDLIIIETFMGLIYEGNRSKVISKISKEPNFLSLTLLDFRDKMSLMI